MLSLRRFTEQSIISLLPLLGGVLAAGLLITLILQAEDASLGAVWDALYAGAWENANNRVRVLMYWMPLLLCSTGLLLTFAAGLWNIGIEGQLTMGAVGAALGALFLRYESQTLQLLVQFVLAAAAGAGWGLLAAILKTRGGVNEIFGGVALNFIAALFSAFLIGGPWSPGQGATGSRTANFDPFTLMPMHDAYPRLSPLALYIGVTAFVIVALLLYFTRFGLQLKAIGKSAASAHALGIPTERNIWLSMAMCGGLAGLAGGVRVLHVTTASLQQNTSGGIGFLALLVVLLAALRPWLTPLIAFAFSFMIIGALRLESLLQIDASLVQVLQGILVLMVLLFDGLRQRIQAAQAQRAIAAETALRAQQLEAQEAPQPQGANKHE